MRTALCPGSFDPFHNGHLDVVERASRLFDHLVIALPRNTSKGEPLFSIEERQEMIAEATAHLGNVRTVALGGLTVDIAKEVGACAIVKGLRLVSDFESELQMAQMNNRLTGIDTLLIPTGPAHSFVSSTLLREVARLGGDVTGLVPPAVARRLQERFA